MIAAKSHGEELPTFANALVASESLTTYKNETLSALVGEVFHGVEPIFTPTGLKEVEAWYFNSSCPAVGKEGFSVPHGIGFFFGEVLCRSAGFSWVVQEYAFRPGCYEIGVNKRLLYIMLTKGKRPTLDRNTHKNSLFREYNRYAP
jgi:hypothetical protein